MKLKKLVATAAFRCGRGRRRSRHRCRPIRTARRTAVECRVGCQRRRTGQPAAAGQGYLPPPGHRGDIDGIVPVWAPPPPGRRCGAPWLPVVWNGSAGLGVWWNGGFIRL